MANGNQPPAIAFNKVADWQPVTDASLNMCGTDTHVFALSFSKMKSAQAGVPVPLKTPAAKLDPRQNLGGQFS